MMINDRNEQLEKLKNREFDLLVIGGGSVGAGIALDASLRGLKVALVEAADFASGSSAKSTKLVHGGVRYLEKAFKEFDYSQYSLVKEALKERKTLLDSAPHLTRVLPIAIPCYSWMDLIYYYLGIKVYELLAWSKNIGIGKFISKSKLLKLLPHVKKKSLKGGVLFYDGQFDDTRMNLSLIMRAYSKGAIVANYVKVKSLEKQRGKIVAATVCNVFTSDEWNIKARVIVNATGAYTDEIRKMDVPDCPSVICGSVGSHIVLDKKYTDVGFGMLIPKSSDDRVLFMLPWQGSTLVGTTDVPLERENKVVPTDEEIKYLLDHLNGYLNINLNNDDVLSSWAGVRPLVDQKAVAKTGSLSRDYVIEVSDSGMYSIYGGKWTLYRKMAEDLVDKVMLREKRLFVKSKTENEYLSGSEDELRELHGIIIREYDLDTDIVDHLVSTYGLSAKQVSEMAAKGHSKRLLKQYPYIEAEVVYAVEHEFACNVDDILYRRVPIALHDKISAESVLERIQQILNEL